MASLSPSLSERARSLARRCAAGLLCSGLDRASAASRARRQRWAARLLAESRPVAWYPGWRFDAGWDDPATVVQRRKSIWQAFHERKLEEPIVVRWYDRLKVHLYLGNDLSRCLFINGCYEPNEFALLSCTLEPGMVFVDGGANDGLYSLLAAKRVGHQGTVVSIEPSRREFERLRSNLRLNRLSRPRPLRLALSDRNETAVLKVASYGHEGQNTLGEFVYEGVTASRHEQVETIRLDDLVTRDGIGRVDYLKLDVEGAEHRALLGARDVLRSCRPYLLIELNEDALRRQGSSWARVQDTLHELGYVIYAFDDRTGKPVRITGGGPLSSNVAACHRERPWRSL